MADLSPASQTLVDQVKVVTRLLKSGIAICVVVVVLKVTAGNQKIKFPWGLELSTDHAWALLVILSLTHLILAIFLIRQAGVALRDPDLASERADILTRATTEAGFFLAGLHRNMRRVSRHVVLRSVWDQSYWVACFGSCIFVAALIPWHLQDGTLRWGNQLQLILLIPLSIGLAAVNWVAGGSWLVALVRLAGTLEDTVASPKDAPPGFDVCGPG